MEGKRMRFAGKRALVTGGSSGIGKGVAEALVAEGAEVFNFDLNYVDIKGVKTIQVDLTDWDLTNKCLDELGPVDLLVNNAGIASPSAEMIDTKRETLDRVLDVDVKAPFHVGQVVAKGMIETGKGGSIVNTSSIAAFCTAHGASPYFIAKAGIQMMTKCMALELGPHQIRVNSVNPGITVDTKLGQEHWSDEVKAAPYRARTPLGRFDKVKDVVGAILFLLSDEAKMITGSPMVVDGGYLVS